MSDISLGSLTDYTTNLLDNAKSSSAASSLSKNVGSLSKDSTDEELLSACKQFESYLWEQVYKEMDKTANVFGTQSEGSYASDLVNMFSDNLIQEISSQSVGTGSNSLAMQLYEQLRRNMGIGVTTPEEIDAAQAAAESGIVTPEE